MRPIRKHIIHCSDSEFGDVKEIRRWHKQRGWADVGYHFIIRRDAEVEIGRPLHITGAHCKGENYDSIGTCVVGTGKGEGGFTLAQLRKLKLINQMLESLFPSITHHPHNEFDNHKTCPNFDIGVLDGIADEGDSL